MIRCVFPSPNPCPLLSPIANLLAEDVRLRADAHTLPLPLQSFHISISIRKRILGICSSLSIAAISSERHSTSFCAYDADLSRKKV